MSWQPEVTKELSNEEKKQFDPGGCWDESPLQRAVVLVSLAGGTGFLDARFVYFCLIFCFLLRAEGNDHLHGMREEANGCVNPIDEEHHQRISNFLPANRLKTNFSVSIRSRRSGK